MWEVISRALASLGPAALALTSSQADQAVMPSDSDSAEPEAESEDPEGLVEYEGMLVSASAAQRRRWAAYLEDGMFCSIKPWSLRSFLFFCKEPGVSHTTHANIILRAMSVTVDHMMLCASPMPAMYCACFCIQAYGIDMRSSQTDV